MNEQDATTSISEKPKEPLWVESLLMLSVLVSLAAFAVGVFEHSWLLILTGAVCMVVCWATKEYINE